MATFYNRVVKNVGTSEITAVTSTSDSTIVLSILAANTQGSNNADVTVIQRDSANVDQGYLASTIIVPPDANIDIIGNKYILPSGNKLNVATSTSGYLDITISYVEV